MRCSQKAALGLLWQIDVLFLAEVICERRSVFREVERFGNQPEQNNPASG